MRFSIPDNMPPGHDPGIFLLEFTTCQFERIKDRDHFFNSGHCPQGQVERPRPVSNNPNNGSVHTLGDVHRKLLSDQLGTQRFDLFFCC